jgi:hypothetical protein
MADYNGGWGEECLIDMIPTSPSTDVPGDGHTVSTGPE